MTCHVASGSKPNLPPKRRRSGTGERADAHQPESGAPINPHHFGGAYESAALQQNDALRERYHAIAVRACNERDALRDIVQWAYDMGHTPAWMSRQQHHALLCPPNR